MDGNLQVGYGTEHLTVLKNLDNYNSLWAGIIIHILAQKSLFFLAPAGVLSVTIH